MGLLGALNASYNRAQASIVIQQLLKTQVECLMLDGNPVAMANRMIERAWAVDPALFEGKSGPKPNKEAVAAYALACAAAWESHVGNEALHVSCTVALGSLMDELNRNSRAYPFHHVDGHLLERAAAGLSKELVALEEIRKRVPFLETHEGTHRESSEDAEFTNTPRLVTAPAREAAAGQGESVEKPRLDVATQAAMVTHGITFERGEYVFRNYRYEKLGDAVNYARLVAQRELV